jgi:hypothetical protein
VYYDTETTIISSDFRPKDNLHICIDEDGHFVMRNLKTEKECKKIKLPKQEYKYVKFNSLNNFQYFVCSEESFKIYDVRNHLEMDSVVEFANSIDIFNDSKNFLLVKTEGLELHTFNLHKVEKLKDWMSFGKVSYANMNSVNYSNPDLIIVGNENGDLFYSNQESIE